MLRFTDRYGQHISRKAEGTISAIASRKIDLFPGQFTNKKIVWDSQFCQRMDVDCSESFLQFPSRYFESLLHKRLHAALQRPLQRTSSN